MSRPARPPHQRSYWIALGLFSPLTLALSGVFWALIIGTGRLGAGHGAYATGLMWCPGLAALVTCAMMKLPMRSLGLEWPRMRWLVLGLLIPSVYSIAAYLGGWSAGLARFPDPEFLTWARKDLGWTRTQPWIVIAGFALLMATTGLVTGVARALGEEIGWRGFLSPRLIRLFGFQTGSLVTGLLWAAWHMPEIFFANYNGGHAAMYGAGCFTVMVLGMSLILDWLRRRSMSVWPCAVLHAGHNLFIQSILTPMTGDNGPITALTIGEFGFAIPAAVVVVAGLILATPQQRLIRSRLPGT